MKVFGDVGSVKHAIKTLHLGAEFEAALRIVEARFVDGIHLDRVPEGQIKTVEITGARPPFPFLEIVSGVSSFSREHQEPIGAEKAEHFIQLRWTADGDDEEAVTAMVERYVLASRKLLMGGLLSPLVNAAPVRVVKEELSQLTFRKDTDSRVWVKVNTLEIAVTTRDTEERS